jgi:hypothetical protein
MCIAIRTSYLIYFHESFKKDVTIFRQLYVNYKITTWAVVRNFLRLSVSWRQVVSDSLDMQLNQKRSYTCVFLSQQLQT